MTQECRKAKIDEHEVENVSISNQNQKESKSTFEPIQIKKIDRAHTTCWNITWLQIDKDIEAVIAYLKH